MGLAEFAIVTSTQGDALHRANVKLFRLFFVSLFVFEPYCLQWSGNGGTQTSNSCSQRQVFRTDQWRLPPYLQSAHHFWGQLLKGFLPDSRTFSAAPKVSQLVLHQCMVNLVSMQCLEACTLGSLLHLSNRKACIVNLCQPAKSYKRKKTLIVLFHATPSHMKSSAKGIAIQLIRSFSFMRTDLCTSWLIKLQATP